MKWKKLITINDNGRERRFRISTSERKPTEQLPRPHWYTITAQEIDDLGNAGGEFEFLHNIQDNITDQSPAIASQPTLKIIMEMEHQVELKNESW